VSANAHAFDRFYRGEEAQRLEPAGTGLGLSIAKWIVERHGGAIALTQRSPRGTTLTVRLPTVEVRDKVGATAA
jgi:signal transduction histidine kinase